MGDMYHILCSNFKRQDDIILFMAFRSLTDKVQVIKKKRKRDNEGGIGYVI